MEKILAKTPHVPRSNNAPLSANLPRWEKYTTQMGRNALHALHYIVGAVQGGLDKLD